MGCGGCNKNQPKAMFEQQVKENNVAPIKNMIKAGSKQSDKISWIRDGLSGIIKCLTGITKYSDPDIQKNREVCRNCAYSTKIDGKLVLKSQCMAPDPQNNNAPCGCIIVCKTQSGDCPLNKWVHLTLERKEPIKSPFNQEQNPEL